MSVYSASANEMFQSFGAPAPDCELPSGSFNFSSSAPGHKTSQKSYVTTRIEDFNGLITHAPQTVQQLTSLLEELRVEGPFVLTNNNRKDNLLGSGLSFNVYSNYMYPPSGVLDKDSKRPIYECAAKRCRLVLDSEENHSNLQVPVNQKRIRAVHLEVLALNNPQLRNHRNIVELLAWGREQGHGGMPLLLVELAIGNLASCLKSQNLNISERHYLCLDLACGLDAVHEAGIVHGDLKPENVLIFKTDNTDVPFVAKLADFGLAAAEASESKRGRLLVNGGTRDWLAPECRGILDGDAVYLSAEEYQRTDIFSLGLTIWSTYCFGGRSPGGVGDIELGKEAGITMSMQASDKTDIFYHTISEAVLQFIQYRNVERPRLAMPSMTDNSKSFKRWCIECERRAQELSTHNTKSDGQEHASGTNVNEWDGIADISKYMFQGITESFKYQRQIMTAAELFAMFLTSSILAAPIDHENPCPMHIELLVRAARKGHLPAQAIVKRVLDSSEISPTALQIEEQELRTWMCAGCKDGSHIAYDDLKELSHEEAEMAKAWSHQHGGSLRPAMRGTWQLLRDQVMNLSKSKVSADDCGYLEDIDADPPYAFCAAGDWEALEALWRIDPLLITRRSSSPDHLHHLCAFQDNHINDAVTMLCSQGADPNGICTRPFFRHHFPFLTTPGSSLHIAVQKSNAVAVAALLRVGADPLLRDRFDHYIYDRNVRSMYLDGNELEGSYGHADHEVQGFNAVDLAVVGHDWKMLQLLFDHGIKDTVVNQTDEEGYAPIHRIVHNLIGRTWSGSRFWTPILTGTRETRTENIERTVETLKNMGADLDSLTNVPESRGADLGARRMSPLMLAAQQSDLDAVQALLTFGAKADTRNDVGANALGYLGEGHTFPLWEPNVALIVAKLLQHGAKPQHTGETDSLYRCPLSSAASTGSVEALRLLFEAGAYVGKHLHEIEALVDVIKAADLNLAATYLRLDAARPKEGAVLKLLEQYVLKDSSNLENISSSVDDDGMTLLHVAVRCMHLQLTRRLLETGCDVNGFNKSRVFSGTCLDYLYYRQTELEVLKLNDELEISGRDASFMYQRLKDIQAILEEHGGCYTRPIGWTGGEVYGDRDT